MKTIEENWYELLGTVIENGETHEKDDGDILQEHLINHCMISNPLKQLGNQNITNEMFIDMIRKGVFNIEGYPIKNEGLAEYVTALDDREQRYNENSDGTKKFVYTYPNRIYNMTDLHSDFMVNQFNLILSRLTAVRLNEKEELEYWNGSNRAVANIYSAVHDCDKNDIPCLNWLQCTVRDNKLILHVMFRSNDLFGAWVGNMYFLSYLGLKFVDALKNKYPTLEFEGINYNSTSLHIYKHDLPKAKEALEKRK